MPRLARQQSGREARIFRQAGMALFGVITAATLATSATCGRPVAGRGDSSDCVWQKLPAEQRGALLEAYSRQGSDGLGSVQISDLTIRNVAKQCNPKQVHLEKLSAAIAGAAMRHGAQAGLIAKGVQPTRLDKTWHAAGSQRMALFAAIQNQDESPEAAKHLFSIVADLVRLAGGSADQRNPMADPVFRLYSDYFLGRALEESSETHP